MAYVLKFILNYFKHRQKNDPCKKFHQSETFFDKQSIQQFFPFSNFFLFQQLSCQLHVAVDRSVFKQINSFTISNKQIYKHWKINKIFSDTLSFSYFILINQINVIIVNKFIYKTHLKNISKLLDFICQRR